MNKFNIKENNPESLSGFIGNPLQDCFTNKYGLIDRDLELAITYYREYFSEKGAYENVIYPGVTGLLSYLKSSGKNVYIVTTKAKQFAVKILEHFKISEYFKNVYGSDLLFYSSINKEKGELIREAIINEKLLNSESIMIGDRKFDINGAKNNGIKTVAVTYGFGSIEELEEAEPDFIVNSVDELYKIL